MIYVIKQNGEKELFSEEKLKQSIRRAGIPEKIEDQVIAHIQSKLHEDIKTSEIYNHISEFLGKSSHPYTKAKYSLKKAIMDLGPTGYPFEDFISNLLIAQGYQTKARQILAGKCITHEIDVIAKKATKNIMIEAKFHNGMGIKTEVHVSLYTKARFDDVKEINNLDEAWLVTNTKATDEAVRYALCSDMTIITWNYPNNYSLRKMIEDAGLHPITTMTTISDKQKQILLQNHIVLCRDILKNNDTLDMLGIGEEKKQTIMDEAGFVCSANLISKL